MSTESAKKPFYKDPTHMLYLSVIAAVILGCILGMTVPDFAKELQPIGTGFIALIKMMIAPVIFCTIVLGVGLLLRQQPSARSVDWRCCTSYSCQPLP